VAVMPVGVVAVPLSGFSEWPHLALQLFVMQSRYIRIVSLERRGTASFRGRADHERDQRDRCCC